MMRVLDYLIGKGKHNKASCMPHLLDGSDLSVTVVRRPPSKKIFNSNDTFGPSAWSFDTVYDSEKRRSPIRYWRIYLYLSELVLVS
jgi:hypothetical protein